MTICTLARRAFLWALGLSLGIGLGACSGVSRSDTSTQPAAAEVPNAAETRSLLQALDTAEQALHQALDTPTAAGQPDPQRDCVELCRLAHTVCELGQRICRLAEQTPEDDALSTACHKAAGRCQRAEHVVRQPCGCAAR